MPNRLIAPALATSVCLCALAAYAISAEAAPGRSVGMPVVNESLTDTGTAGPLGFLFGALSGAFMASQGRLAGEAERSLALAHRDQAQWEERMIDVQDRLDKQEASPTQALGLQIMFSTGDDRMSEFDRERIQTLAAFLTRRPQLVIEIDGYADPRGSDEYNHVLSLERARSIAYALETLGVDPARIQVRGHGADLSRAAKGDLGAYAQERRAYVSVLSPDDQVLAQRAF